LVTGHYPSLADNPGIAPEPDQTGFQQSDLKTLRKPPGGLRAVFLPPQLFSLLFENSWGAEPKGNLRERPRVSPRSEAVLPVRPAAQG
jgi:hypothetical protein